MSGEVYSSDNLAIREPLVSIIMNCYNGERFLREAINSIYNQTYRNWEIIFWDNASTDSSRKIAQQYDARLKYFFSDKNVPLGEARNKALRQAEGEFICFLDTDDLWMPDKLMRQVQAMAAGPYILGYAGIENIDGVGRSLGKYQPTLKSGDIFEALLRQFDINIPTAILRKSALVNSGLTFDSNIQGSEEYCLFMQFIIDKPVLVMRDVLAKYRIHAGALTLKVISRWAIEREYTLDLIKARHPGIDLRFQGAFKEAEARAVYYRARYLISIGDLNSACKELNKIKFYNVKYFLLYILARCPKILWVTVHSIKNKRNI